MKLPFGMMPSASSSKGAMGGYLRQMMRFRFLENVLGDNALIYGMTGMGGGFTPQLMQMQLLMGGDLGF